MHAIAKTLTLLLAILALVTGAFGDVANNDKYRCGPNGTVTAHVSVDFTTNVANVSFTRDGNESNSTTGTPGDSGGDTCEDTDGTMSEGSDEDELECRVEGDKWQYKNDTGDWIDAGSPRKRRTPGAKPPHNDGGDSEAFVPSHVVWPGKEIVSLP